MADLSSTDSSQQYDLSFAYSYHWNYAEADIHRALKILLSVDTEEDELSLSGFSSAQDIRRIRCLLASNPNTPTPVLDHLTKCADPMVLERIAENPSTSAATLSRLSGHKDPEVRSAVAENTHTSSETVERLSADECADVRFRLAENHNTPHEILEQLSSDENPYVASRAQTTLLRLGAGAGSLRILPAPKDAGSLGCWSSSAAM